MGVMNRPLQKGDWIKCSGEADVRECLAELSKAGYGATVTSGNYICITSVPEKMENEQ